MPESEFERRQEDAAAAEAGSIGGRVSSDPPSSDGDVDEAQRPLAEAGQGESEGFEEAERELGEHASHGDQHAARRVNEDAPSESADARAAEDAEADAVRSSQLQDGP
jgi:hypothetical protein